MLIKPSQLINWNAGDAERRITKHIPDCGMTPLQVATDADLPVEDRLWVLLRSEVLGNSFSDVLYRIVDPVVESQCLHCEVESLRIWAALWLSGIDRSVAAARSARASHFVNAVTYTAMDATVRAAHAAADALTGGHPTDAAQSAYTAAYCIADAVARSADAVAHSQAYAAERDRQLVIVRSVLGDTNLSETWRSNEAR